MDAHGNTTNLTQVTEHKGIKMLGVIKAAILDEIDKFKHLMDCTTSYMCITRACPLELHEVWLGYKTVYLACVQYPLSTTSSNNDQINKSYTAIVPRLLPNMGYSRTLPSAVVFG
eukprot:4388105-Ditylum_brightwellii.AAC.1